MTAAVTQEQEILKTEISLMLNTMSVAHLRRIKAKIEKRKLPITRTRCAPHVGPHSALQKLCPDVDNP